MRRSIGLESVEGRSLAVTRTTYWWSWKAVTPATLGGSIRCSAISSSAATSAQ